MPSSYRVDYEAVEFERNIDMPDDVFAHDVEGYTQVADMDELMHALGGADMDMPEVDLLDEEAPDFTLTLLDGESFRLTDHRGKIVLIDFWATWCPPCVESLPFLQGLHEKWGDDVVMVGVSVDDAAMENRVRAMAERFGLGYAVGIDDADIAESYGIFSIPTMLVLDREGVVREQKIGFTPDGMEALREATERIVAE